MTDGYLGPRQHALAVGFVVFGSLLLAFAPHAVLGMHYECVLHSMTGLRCPFCGMTRDFMLMTHGSLPRNNPGSLMVAFGLYVVYPLWLLIAVPRRRCWLLLPRESVIKALMVAMAVLFVCNNLVG